MSDTATSPAAVFFDLDDTLLDDGAATSAGLRHLMRHLDHPDFTAARRLWQVQTDISFGAYLDGRLTLAQQRRERVRALAVQAGYRSIDDARCDTLYERYLEGHRTGWRAFDDVAATLRGLAAARVPLGVVTNGVAALQREKLAALGIAARFSVVVCADEAGAAKPDPRIFHGACARLGLAPRDCWHVGDQVRADALGAVEAGLGAVLLDRAGRHPAVGAGVRVVGGLAELPRLLELPPSSGVAR